MGLQVPDERAALAEQAREMQRLSADERVRLFCSIMDTIAGIWATLPLAEQLRRLRIGEEIDRGPRPWWLGLRAEARP